MTRDRAVLDANVLYAYFLRDLLLSLFAEGLYEAKWTDRINAEWVEHLLENDQNTSPDILKRTLQLMNAINPSPLVTDYEELIAALQLLKCLEAVEKLLIDFSGKFSAEPAGVWLNRPKHGWKPAPWSYRSKS
jgi:hypothetical protein